MRLLLKKPDLGLLIRVWNLFEKGGFGNFVLPLYIFGGSSACDLLS